MNVIDLFFIQSVVTVLFLFYFFKFFLVGYAQSSNDFNVALHFLYMLTVSFVYILYKVYISLERFVLILHKFFLS